MRRVWRVMAAVAVMALIVAGCGGGGSGDGAQQASSDDAGATREAGGDSEDEGDSAAASTGDDELDAIIDRAENVEDATFRATYRTSDDSEMTMVQTKGKSRFESDGVILIDDGEHSYTCNDSDEQCIEGESTGGNFAAGMLMTPAIIVQSLQVWRMVPGLDVDRSNRTAAGEDLECVTLRADGQDPATFCMTDDGVLGYQDDGTTKLELIDYTTDVDNALFEPPYDVVTMEDLTNPSSSESSGEDY